MDSSISKALCSYIAKAENKEQRKLIVSELKKTIDAIAKIANIVQERHLDDETINDISLDDNGHCIHVELSDWVYQSMIEDIGIAFGDENVSVTVLNGNVTLVILNTDKRYRF